MKGILQTELSMTWKKQNKKLNFGLKTTKEKDITPSFFSVTSEEKVKKLLKGFSKQFYEAHKKFQDPRDEYTLSHVSNADMVVEELVSTF